MTARNPQWAHDTEVAGFTKLPDDSRWVRLGSMRDDIARQVKEVVNVDGQNHAILRRPLRAWKGGKLVLNPGSHVRMPWRCPSWRCWMAINPGIRECPLPIEPSRCWCDGGPRYAELIESRCWAVMPFHAGQNRPAWAAAGQATVENYDGGRFCACFPASAPVPAAPTSIWRRSASRLMTSTNSVPPASSGEWAHPEKAPRKRGSGMLTTTAMRPALSTNSAGGDQLFTSFWRESMRIFPRAAMERPLMLAAIMGMARGITGAIVP